MRDASEQTFARWPVLAAAALALAVAVATIYLSMRPPAPLPIQVGDKDALLRQAIGGQGAHGGGEANPAMFNPATGGGSSSSDPGQNLQLAPQQRGSTTVAPPASSQ